MAEASCTPIPSRRSLFLAAAALPGLGLAAPAAAQPHGSLLTSRDEEAEFARRVAIFEARLVTQQAAAAAHDLAEQASFAAFARAKKFAEAEPFPAAAMIYKAPEVLSDRAGRVEVTFAGGFERARDRTDLLILVHEHPTQQHRLAAWDEYERRRAAHLTSPEMGAAERRESVLWRRWERARGHAERALRNVLSYQTLSPTALRTKLDLAGDHDPQHGMLTILLSLCALLGVEGHQDTLI